MTPEGKAKSAVVQAEDELSPIGMGVGRMSRRASDDVVFRTGYFVNRPILPPESAPNFPVSRRLRLYGTASVNIEKFSVAVWSREGGNQVL